MRVTQANARPMRRALERRSCGSLLTAIEMKTRLSTPSTISSVDRVSSAIQVCGSVSNSKRGNSERMLDRASDHPMPGAVRGCPPRENRGRHPRTAIPFSCATPDVLQSTKAQHNATLNISNNTAAEPMSLARAASSWNSGLTLSMTASTAELSSSIDRTSNRLPHSNAFSTAPLPSHSPTGSNTIARQLSRRNEASCRHAARSPFIDHCHARQIWRGPRASVLDIAVARKRFRRPRWRGGFARQAMSSSFAALTSSRRRTGVVIGASFIACGFSAASLSRPPMTSTNSSSVSLASVSVGSISRHSGTSNGK